jgi:hypothetical protein
MKKDDTIEELVKLVSDELLQGKSPAQIRQHLAYVGFDSVDISKAISAVTKKTSVGDSTKGVGKWLLKHWWLFLIALAAGAILMFKNDFSFKEYGTICVVYLILAFLDMFVSYYIILEVKPEKTPPMISLFLASLIFSIVGGIWLPLYPAGILLTFILMTAFILLFFGLEIPLASLCGLALLLVHGMAILILYLILNNSGVLTRI